MGGVSECAPMLTSQPHSKQPARNAASLPERRQPQKRQPPSILCPMCHCHFNQPCLRISVVGGGQSDDTLRCLGLTEPLAPEQQAPPSPARPRPACERRTKKWGPKSILGNRANRRPIRGALGHSKPGNTMVRHSERLKKMARSFLQVGSFFVLTAAGLGAIVPGCSSPFSGCEASRTCLPSGGAGDSKAGAPGDAGSSGEAAESGDAGRGDGASGNASDGGAGGEQATNEAGVAGTAVSTGEGGTTSDGGASSSEAGAGGEAGAPADVCQVVSWTDLNGTPCTCAANNITNGQLKNDFAGTAKTYYCRQT